MSTITIHQSDPWKRTLLPLPATLDAAIRNLDNSQLQIAIVVSPEGRLLGTITDGDVRRGLLRGLTLDSSIESIIYPEPLVVPPEVGRDTALQIMQANRVHQLPIVDDQRRVVGLHVWSSLLNANSRDNLMVIMAGGEGQRLRPHTETCPKPLLPVRGKPILQHIIERAREEGFHRFRLAVHYRGDMIEEFFGDGGRWNVEIDYIREPQPLGTAGGLGLLVPRPDTTLIVTNGDVLTDVHYGDVIDFHSRHRAVATMAVRLFEWQHPFGVVHTNGVDIVGFEEKPVARSHINAGVYVLEPAALDMVGAGQPCDMPTLFSRARVAGRTIVYPMHEPWLDVGSPRDWQRAQDQDEQQKTTIHETRI